MTLEIFLILLTILSTVTSLFTEALKKLFVKMASNLIVLISAIVIGGGGTIVYYVAMGIEFDLLNILCILVMIVFNWLGAMLGYDKVIQAISQLKEK